MLMPLGDREHTVEDALIKKVVHDIILEKVNQILKETGFNLHHCAVIYTLYDLRDHFRLPAFSVLSCKMRIIPPTLAGTLIGLNKSRVLK